MKARRLANKVGLPVLFVRRSRKAAQRIGFAAGEHAKAAQRIVDATGERVDPARRRCHAVGRAITAARLHRKRATEGALAPRRSSRPRPREVMSQAISSPCLLEH